MVVLTILQDAQTTHICTSKDFIQHCPSSVSFEHKGCNTQLHCPAQPPPIVKRHEDQCANQKTCVPCSSCSSNSHLILNLTPQGLFKTNVHDDTCGADAPSFGSRTTTMNVESATTTMYAELAMAIMYP